MSKRETENKTERKNDLLSAVFLYIKETKKRPKRDQKETKKWRKKGTKITIKPIFAVSNWSLKCNRYSYITRAIILTIGKFLFVHYFRVKLLYIFV